MLMVLPIQVSKGQGGQPIPGGTETEPIISIVDATQSAPGVAIQAIGEDDFNVMVVTTTRDGHPIFATPKHVTYWY